MARQTTFKGGPLELTGPELKVGDKAPDFSVVDKTLTDVNLAGTGHGVRAVSYTHLLQRTAYQMFEVDFVLGRE